MHISLNFPGPISKMGAFESNRISYSFLSSSRWIAVVAAVLISGCASKPIGVLDKQTDAPSASESILVQGIEPNSYEVVFHKGRINNGKFETTETGTFLKGLGIDGYVVGKASAGELVAVTSFYRPKQDNGRPGNFEMCGNNVLVFKVPAGKVVYLGNITFAESGNNSFRVTYSSSFDTAKKHIDSDYPALSGRLEPIFSETVPFACRGSGPRFIWMPVYSGKR